MTKVIRSQSRKAEDYQFHGCLFSVNQRVPWVSQECSGIVANSAGFTIDAFCDANILPCPEESLIRSSFTGFHFGIKSSNNGGTARTFSVKNSTFKDNNIGIYAENTGYATIIMNNFNVGINADCNFGIYADNITGFCIEENNFSGNPQSSNDMYGIVIHNSRNYNNVYLNNFYGLTCGNIAIGDNMEPGLSAISSSISVSVSVSCMMSRPLSSKVSYNLKTATKEERHYISNNFPPESTHIS